MHRTIKPIKFKIEVAVANLNKIYKTECRLECDKMP